ncbi:MULTISPECIES: hypothetical protein [Desertifilum]|nr:MULTISPECIES: hypothetical protein [Desertifilum]
MFTPRVGNSNLAVVLNYCLLLILAKFGTADSAIASQDCCQF